MSNPFETARHLISHHASLSSIASAAKWRSDADSVLASLATTEVSSQERARSNAHQTTQLRIATKEKSFLGRFFKSSDEKAARLEGVELQRTFAICRSLANNLQEKTDETPATKEEQAQLVRELRTTKKELQLQKKEVNAEMKNIRTVARQKSASAATSLTTLIVGQKYTATERRNIRNSKERALTPHEDARVTLDRLLFNVEREILRMESYR